MRDTRPFIVHIITRLELGGAQQNTLDMCRLLDRSRYRVALISGTGGRLESEAARISDLDFRLVPELVREVNPIRDYSAFRIIRDHLRQFSEDGAPVVVHTHSSKAGILGRFAASSANIPHVFHSVHGFGHPAFSSFFMRQIALMAERIAARKTTRFLPVSNANIDEGNRLRLFGDRKVDLLRSAIDSTSYRAANLTREAAREELNLPPGIPIVGTISPIKPQKDPLTFVRVAARVIRNMPETHFLLVGDGEMRGEVESQARDLGIHRSLTLLGWRDDVPQLLRAMNVFCLTSRWEGLPRVIVQAMASGVPVVATGVDGVLDIVRHGETGHLSPPGDVSSIATGILEFLDNPDRCQEITASAAQIVPEFEIERMIEKLDSLYREELS